MKVVVVGTSNSILRGGYVDGLASYPTCSEVINCSLGASTSVVLPKVKREVNSNDVDFVIVDFSINEEFWYKIKRFTLDDVRNLLDDFFSSLPRQTVPVIVIMPTEDGYGQMLPVRSFYRDYAASRGYPLFDGFDYAATLVAGGADVRSLFMDRDHLKPTVAWSFGKQMAAALAGLERRLPARAELPAHSYDYLFADQIKEVDAEFVDRKTSLAHGRFVIVRPGASVTFEAYQTDTAVGVGLNYARSNTAFSIVSGTTKRDVDARSRYFSEGDGLVYVVLPIQPVPGSAFKCSLPPDSPANAMIEIGGLTMRGRSRTVSVPEFSVGQGG